MLFKDYEYPVPYHDTWDIQDNSKISEAKSCLRKYFFRYILGWTLDTPNIHLVFGRAWHEGKEYLIRHGLTYENVVEAMELFTKVYAESFPTRELWYEKAPKDPHNALIAYKEYVDLFHQVDRYEVVDTEIAGDVQIRRRSDDSLQKLTFKIDAIVYDRDGFWILEHKTGSQDSAAWRAQWTGASQLFIYTHALYSYFPHDQIWGAKVDGTILRKSGNLHVRIPIRKTPEQMRAWLYDIDYFLGELDDMHMRLIDCKVTDPVMAAFPRNDNACTDFNRPCMYHDVCWAWNNPLQRCQRPPIGFKYEWWNPKAQEEKAKAIYKDGKITRKEIADVSGTPALRE